MSRNSSSSSNGGLSFSGALQIVFIVLKLCKVINWSWWVVLIPIWIDLVIIIGFLLWVWWLNNK